MFFIYVLSGLCVGTVTTYAIVEEIKREIKKWSDELDSEVLEYCINRSIIVCPRCSSLYEVQDLEEQLNLEWTCTSCGQIWEETPTHDIKIRRKK